MLREYNNKANIGLCVGMLLGLAALMMKHVIPSMGSYELLLIGVGTIPFTWGCCCYAIGKGYPWPQGFLGLLDLLGLIVLLVLPDKNK